MGKSLQSHAHLVPKPPYNIARLVRIRGGSGRRGRGWKDVEESFNIEADFELDLVDHDCCRWVRRKAC